jgi:DUF4097 and DUF4098 domain-containing protein YvlB
MPVFETPGPISATIDLVVGDARISAGERTDTVVEIRPTDPDAERDVQAAEQTRVEFSDGRLLVRAPRQRKLGLFGTPASVDVEISLPTGSRLQGDAQIANFAGTGPLGDVRIKTAIGDVRLEATGDLDLSTSTGDVTVHTVAGSASVRTGSGALRVDSVGGPAVLKNANGGCVIGDVGGELRVSASNGDITVGRAGAGVIATTANGAVRIGEVSRGTVSLKSAFGELEVGVAPGTAVHLDLHTKFGTVHNRLETAGQPEPGEQTVEVRARTSYGDILIRRPAGDLR